MDSLFSISQEEIKAQQASFITKVYSWMALALLITGFAAMFVSQSETLTRLIFSNRITYIVLLFVEIGIVTFLSARINKMSSSTATAIFIGYSILNGVTLAFVFLVYTAGSIASTFFVTAGTFAGMSAYGYFTKQDLTKFGNLLRMALLGLIIASIVNIFWANSTLYWISTYAGILIFVGLTAYDTQKIKDMSIVASGNGELEKKGAIMGALQLYLDFINLFLFLLRIFGDRRN